MAKFQMPFQMSLPGTTSPADWQRIGHAVVYGAILAAVGVLQQALPTLDLGQLQPFVGLVLLPLLAYAHAKLTDTTVYPAPVDPRLANVTAVVVPAKIDPTSPTITPLT